MGRTKPAKRIDNATREAWWGELAETTGLPPTEPPQKMPWPEFARQTYIRSGRGIVPFDPWDYQLLFEQLMQSHNGIVIGKTRQVGVSELIANIILWMAYLDPSFLAVVFSQGQDESGDIARRVRMMAALAPFLDVNIANTKEISLVDGGRLLFKPSTPNAGRSVPSAHCLFFDECAFVPNIEEIYGAALPATEMVSNAKIVLVSTPPKRPTGFFWEYLTTKNGDRDFDAECDLARESGLRYWTDEEGWLKCLLHWKAHPIYSQQSDYLQRKRTELKLSQVQVEREFNLGFKVSGESIINPQWFRYYRTPPHPTKMKIVQSWDTAATANSTSAYWACTTWGLHENDYYLLDAYWKRHQYADGYRAVIAQAAKWNPFRVLIEDKSTGITLLQDLPRDRAFRSHCVGIKPKGSKAERLESESPAYETHRVLHPQSAPWLADVEAMLEAFPEGEILDVCDSISQFLHWGRTGIRGWGWG